MIVSPEKMLERLYPINGFWTARKILEAVAVEGYRQGTLSRGQVSELLGLSFQDTEAFLKERKAYSPYSLLGVEKGRTALEGLLKR